jgi:hypothetical protein
MAAIAATVAGTATSVVASQQQAKAAEGTAKYNAEVDKNNALAAQQAAEAEAAQIRRLNRIRQGSARASYGKAGVSLESGQDALTDLGTQGELEALSTLYAGQTQASYYNSRSTGSLYSGRNARAAGNLATASSLIGGLADTASTYNRVKPAFGNKK